MECNPCPFWGLTEALPGWRKHYFPSSLSKAFTPDLGIEQPFFLPLGGEWNTNFTFLTQPSPSLGMFGALFPLTWRQNKDRPQGYQGCAFPSLSPASWLLGLNLLFSNTLVNFISHSWQVSFCFILWVVPWPPGTKYSSCPIPSFFLVPNNAFPVSQWLRVVLENPVAVSLCQGPRDHPQF